MVATAHVRVGRPVDISRVTRSCFSIRGRSLAGTFGTRLTRAVAAVPRQHEALQAAVSLAGSRTPIRRPRQGGQAAQGAGAEDHKWPDRARWQRVPSLVKMDGDLVRNLQSCAGGGVQGRSDDRCEQAAPVGQAPRTARSLTRPDATTKLRHSSTLQVIRATAVVGVNSGQFVTVPRQSMANHQIRLDLTDRRA